MVVRVGFLGAGFIATFHSKLLRASGVEHERAGVHDPDRARAEAFVAAAGGFVAGSEDEVLTSFDAVFVCTWTSDHEAQVRRATEAGVAVFVEKPLSTDLLDRLLGPITSVSGRQRSFHGIEGIEDVVLATFDLAGGGVASLTTVWHDLPERNSLRYLEVHCERAFLSAEEDSFGPVRHSCGGEVHEWAGEELLAECERRGIPTTLPDGEFIRAVAAGEAASPDAAVALRAHELCDAVYRSSSLEGTPLPV